MSMPKKKKKDIFWFIWCLSFLVFDVMVGQTFFAWVMGLCLMAWTLTLVFYPYEMEE